MTDFGPIEAGFHFDRQLSLESRCETANVVGDMFALAEIHSAIAVADVSSFGRERAS